VPAGQLKNAAPSGARSAGQSATLENPAHFLALLIVTGTAKTLGLVRAANRAGCRQAAQHKARPATPHPGKWELVRIIKSILIAKNPISTGLAAE
jgi:hypothetical protein